ncbi:MAG TPA: hypothetical protein VFJ69_01475, partial [Actinomycetota bacterium]|nr:hypothetical protein [Actinomycetota bacterium]
MLDGLELGAAAERQHGRGLKIGPGPGVRAAVQEVGGELGDVLGRRRSVGPLQPVGHGRVQPGLPAGRDSVVQHRPVEVVGEREPGRHGAVRPVDRVTGPQEPALSGQGRA